MLSRYVGTGLAFLALATVVAFRPAPVRYDIEGAMHTIDETTKQLQQTLEDKDKTADNLTTIERLEQAFMTCKAATPPKAQGMEGKDLEKFMAEYRTMNIEALQMVLDMEAEVVKGKGKNAKKTLNKIIALKGKGHGKFKD